MHVKKITKLRRLEMSVNLTSTQLKQLESQSFYLNGRGDRLKFIDNGDGFSIWALFKPNSDEIQETLNFEHFMQYGEIPSDMDIVQPENGLLPFDHNNPVIGSFLRISNNGEEYTAVLVFDNYLIPNFERNRAYNRFLVSKVYNHFLDEDAVCEIRSKDTILGVIAFPGSFGAK